MKISFRDRVGREDLAYAVVYAEGVAGGPASLRLKAALDACERQRRAGALEAEAETRRRKARDVLRNGTYKPTGRAKPASEYLLRAAAEGQLPRINGLVDANNLISLSQMVPVSVWDVDLAQGQRYEIRLGREEESYVFNSSGQQLALQDLVCGCVFIGEQSCPCVTPVKDSMATKVKFETSRAAGVIYYPLVAGDTAHLQSLAASFASWLATCGPTVRTAHAVLMPGADVDLSPTNVA